MHVIPRLQSGRWARVGNAVKWGVGVALLGSIMIVGGFVPLARFTQERVEIAVYPDHIEVDGAYLFENRHWFPIRQTCTFPVAEEEGISPAVDMCAFRLHSDGGTDSGAALPVRNVRCTQWFSVMLKPKEKAWIAVRYRQNASQRRGGYVVTSTQSWGRPLDSASFRLRPRGVKIVQSSYRLEAADLPDALGFDWHGFMPEHDWTFAWEVL